MLPNVQYSPDNVHIDKLLQIDVLYEVCHVTIASKLMEPQSRKSDDDGIKSIVFHHGANVKCYVFSC